MIPNNVVSCFDMYYISHVNLNFRQTFLQKKLNVEVCNKNAYIVFLNVAQIQNSNLIVF